MTARKTYIERNTSETQIKLNLDLDPKQNQNEPFLDTGSKFLDHMLDIFRKHSGVYLSIDCQGDTEIDMHHTTEDIAICLGEAIFKCLKNKEGIERYGFYYVVMDDALSRVTLDLCNRISFIFKAEADLKQQKIGNLDLELIPHFFETLAQNSKMNLHIDLLRGHNAHHCIEASFKAFARAFAMAISPSQRVKGIPSTKGNL